MPILWHWIHTEEQYAKAHGDLSSGKCNSTWTWKFLTCYSLSPFSIFFPFFKQMRHSEVFITERQLIQKLSF